MKRTIVFTLPRGLKAVPKDFEPVLDIVIGKMLAFGTVGVGHVWHVTLLDDQSASMLLDQGHFSLHGKEVSVARLSTLAHTAFLYWLPFWIPNDLVEEALESLLGDCVTSTYVRMSQPGYQDCYTTQRKITSAVSLDGLPYFLPIEFERVTHRACLFVPGRQPICFQCGQVGHMRNQCHGVKPSVVQDPCGLCRPDRSDAKQKSSMPATDPFDSQTNPTRSDSHREYSLINHEQ